MRKLLEAISATALASLIWLTYDALFGPGHLPSRIPTHFDIDGTPNAWGEPKMLLLLPGIAVAIYLLMTLVSRYPSAFNYPVRVTSKNQQRLQNLALNMIASLKAETVCLFTALQYFTIQAIRTQRNSLPPALMLTALAVIFLTIGTHIVAMRRTSPR